MGSRWSSSISYQRLKLSWKIGQAGQGRRESRQGGGIHSCELLSNTRALKDEARLAEMLDRQAIRHLGKPEEVAEMALLLASERGSYITGQTFVVDGGRTVASGL